ncbi:MAG TPA: hypothetical protein VF791_13695 [Pyrinomonadaceae bacterium]
MADQALRLLAEAGLLPRAMPNNFTFNKVKEILLELENAGQDKLREAIEAAKGLQIHGPLAAVIFIKHHLEGAHEVEVDRIVRGEDGADFTVLVYPEGEVPIRMEYLHGDVRAGRRAHYDPSERRYRQ